MENAQLKAARHKVPAAAAVHCEAVILPSVSRRA